MNQRTKPHSSNGSYRNNQRDMSDHQEMNEGNPMELSSPPLHDDSISHQYHSPFAIYNELNRRFALSLVSLSLMSLQLLYELSEVPLILRHFQTSLFPEPFRMDVFRLQCHELLAHELASLHQEELIESMKLALQAEFGTADQLKYF
jgi:hypothetical protein